MSPPPITRSGDIHATPSPRVTHDRPSPATEHPMRTITKAAAVALALVAAGFTYRYATEDTITCTITDKERVYGMDGLVRAHRIDTDCGTFAVADWDSRDLYRSLQIGDTYDLTVTGVRVDALDWHPTVTDAEPVDDQQ